jgi:predicted NUDIX family phosphoesterase
MIRGEMVILMGRERDQCQTRYRVQNSLERGGDQREERGTKIAELSRMDNAREIYDRVRMREKEERPTSRPQQSLPRYRTQ